MSLSLNAALAEMRLPSNRIASMIHEAASAVGDTDLLGRLRTDRSYHQRAAHMTQSLVLGFTMAQTMNEDTDFAGMFADAQLAHQDPGLVKLGRQLADWMAQGPLRVDGGISRELLASRVAAITAAI